MAVALLSTTSRGGRESAWGVAIIFGLEQLVLDNWYDKSLLNQRENTTFGVRRLVRLVVMRS